MKRTLASLLILASLRLAAAPAAPGEAADLSPWAYPYRRGSAANPPEAGWLQPHKTLRWDTINGSLVWYYDDSTDVLPRGAVLAGLLWEEPRDVQHVTLEFPNAGGHVPGVGEILVAARSAASPWEDVCRKPPYSAVVADEQGHPAAAPQGTTSFRFNLACQPLTKLYVIYLGRDPDVAVPSIHAYGKARWMKESLIDVEWGFARGGPRSGWLGRVEAYNGLIRGIAPLVSRDGSRRGIRVRLLATDDPGNSRTLLTLRGGAEDVTVALRALDEGPVLIPGAGIFVAKSGSGASAAEFARQLAAKGLRTTRERVEAAPEESWESAMRRFHPGMQFPDFPVPPIKPVMTIDVPEVQLVRQWELGAWHLERWCQKCADGSYAVSIWPYGKSNGGNEGTVALGSESFLNIRVLDMMGLHDLARGGLDYWLFGPHATPFIWDAGVMGRDALCNPYNSPNRRSPGYDQKHSSGHGRIMAAASFHYRMTRDRAWWAKAAPVLQRAGEATIRLRDAWDATQPAGSWTHGLMPPSNISDNNDNRLFYAMSGFFFQGLNEVSALLEHVRAPRGPDLVRESVVLRGDIRRAVDRSLALTQVVRVADGTYRRDFSFMPCIRGLAEDIDSGAATGHSRYYEGKMGSLTLVEAGVIDPRDPIVGDLLDVYEDRLVRDGQNEQNSYNNAPGVYLARDDIPMFLRGFYNGYAAEIDPGNGYTLWEGTDKSDARDKTFEEAGFLRNVRMMLVMEEGGTLWLARGTPRAWLGQGRRIAVSRAPTCFGEAAYTITSDAANGAINAVVDLPSRNPPDDVRLRLRHPAAARIRSVRVDGKPWTDFDPAGEYVDLKGLSGRVTVTALY
jgi:hypothetical protein